MKKIKFTGKLSLNKETVSKLNEEQMSRAYGGATRFTTCANCATDLCPATNVCPSIDCGSLITVECC